MAAPATPAGLAVQPTPAGLKVGCSVTANADEYQFRHSTDEAAWTTRTAISGNFETIPSLLYTTTYFVQVRASNGDGDSDWSASVQGQPWIDVDSEWSPVHHVTAVHEPTNHGDLGGTYETNDWAIACVVDIIKTGVVQTLFGWQAQIASGDGRAGMFTRIDAGDELDCLTVVGSSSLETASASSYISAAGRKVLMVRKVGTALRIYDEDATQIGTATLSSATMDWTTSGSLRTSTLGHWNSETTSLDSQMYGGVQELVGIPDTVTDAERDAVLRWLREYWLEREDESRVDLFADAVDVDNDTTSGASAVALSKQGLVINFSSPSPYEELRYLSVIKIADDDWAVLAGVREYDGGYALSAVAKFTSSDGLSWAAPNLGLITYDGNTDNALILDTAGTDTVQNVIYNPDAPAGEEFLWLFENVNSDPGLKIYKSANLTSTPTLVHDIADSLSLWSPNAEGKALVEREDGKFIVFYVGGFGTEMRTIASVLSIGSDPAGEFFAYDDDIAAFTPSVSTGQFYAIRVLQLAADYWLGFVTRYNSTSETSDIDLYVSRDKGASWTQAAASWLPNGTSGTYDDSLAWADTLIQVGDDWRFYYAASTTLHDTDPKPDFGLAYATVGYRRLFSIATTGTVRSTPILTDSDTAVSVNADGSGGDVTVAVLDASDNSTISGYGGTVSTDEYGEVFTLPPHREVKLAFTLASGAVLYSYEVGALADLQSETTGTGTLIYGGFEMEGAGVSTITGSGLIIVPEFRLAGTEDAITGTGLLILPEFRMAGEGASAIEGTGTLILPEFRMAGSGVTGGVTGTGLILIPEFRLAGSAEETLTGTGLLLLPRFLMSGTGYTEAPAGVALTIDGLAIPIMPVTGWQAEAMARFAARYLPGNRYRSAHSTTRSRVWRWQVTTPFRSLAEIATYEAVIRQPGRRAVSGYLPETDTGRSLLFCYHRRLRKTRSPQNPMSYAQLSFTLQEADPVEPT